MGRAENEPIRIAVSTNGRYAPHLAVMLASLVSNHVSPYPLEVFVLHGKDLNRSTRQRLDRSMNPYRLQLRYVQVPRELFDDYKLFHYFSHENYYRLALQELLPQEVKKIIYLDCDLIVKNDILHLWETDVTNHAIGAAFDSYAQESCDRLNIPKVPGYFNSGVLVINLDWWRKERVLELALTYLSRHHEQCLFADQDVLNVLFQGDWLPLEGHWNCLAAYADLCDRAPSIIHYTGANKPWNSSPNRAMEYFKYAEFTNF